MPKLKKITILYERNDIGFTGVQYKTYASYYWIPIEDYNNMGRPKFITIAITPGKI